MPPPQKTAASTAYDGQRMPSRKDDFKISSSKNDNQATKQPGEDSVKFPHMTDAELIRCRLAYDREEWQCEQCPCQNKMMYLACAGCDTIKSAPDGAPAEDGWRNQLTKRQQRSRSAKKTTEGKRRQKLRPRRMKYSESMATKCRRKELEAAMAFYYACPLKEVKAKRRVDEGRKWDKLEYATLVCLWKSTLKEIDDDSKSFVMEWLGPSTVAHNSNMSDGAELRGGGGRRGAMGCRHCFGGLMVQVWRSGDDIHG